jgi:TRAP-type transport system periplasmic protein
MCRRFRFLLSAAVALVLGAFVTAGCAAAAKAEAITLKAASAFPRSHANNIGYLEFIDAVNKAGAGLVHIDFIGGPEIAPPKQQPVALRNGLFDLLFGPCAYYLGLFPEADFTAGFKTPMEARKLGGYKLVDGAMRRKLGATFVARFDSGQGLYLMLDKKPRLAANGLPDLTWMRLRSSPAYRDFIKRLGGEPVVMPITQMYTALQRGLVVGVGTGLSDVQEFGLARYLKYRIEPPFDMAGIIVIANAAKWDGLPPKVRDLIQSTAIDYEKITMDKVASDEAKAKAALDKAGQQVIAFKGAQAKAYVDTFMQTPWGRMAQNPNIHISVSELKRDWY